MSTWALPYCFSRKSAAPTQLTDIDNKPDVLESTELHKNNFQLGILPNIIDTDVQL